MTIARPLTERHAERVDQRGDDECWPWLGWINHHRGGYGGINAGGYRGRTLLAHRVAYSIANDCDYPPPGVVIMHTCDNPRCQNPRHLVAGTPAENHADSVRKGRHFVPTPRIAYGADHWLSKLSHEQRELIIERYAQGARQTALALEFGVTQTTISKVVNRRIQYSALRASRRRA